jgi:hypothetical protein
VSSNAIVEIQVLLITKPESVSSHKKHEREIKFPILLTSPFECVRQKRREISPTLLHCGHHRTKRRIPLHCGHHRTKRRIFYTVIMVARNGESFYTVAIVAQKGESFYTVVIVAQKRRTLVDVEKSLLTVRPTLASPSFK